MLLGMIAGFLGSSLGWQINLLTIQRGLRRGRIAALLVGCGAISADLIFLFFGFKGTKPLLEHPEWWEPIRWVGIATLFILAARSFFVYQKKEEEVVEVSKRNPTKNFILGFLIVITNPAVFLLWVGVVGFLFSHFPQTRQPWFKEFFLAGFVMGGLSWFIPYVAFVMKHVKKWDPDHLHFLSRLSAASLVIIAFVLIFERFGFPKAF